MPTRTGASWPADGRREGPKNKKRPAQRSRPRPALRAGRLRVGAIHHCSIARCYPSSRPMSSPVRACALAGDPVLTAPPARLPGSAEPTWLASLPGCPVRSPRPADVVAPVAWFAVADSRPPRGPVARTPIPSTRRITPHRHRFRLVTPVGPSLLTIPLLVSPFARGRSSGSGWRALAGTDVTLHDLFPLVKWYFSIHRVIPRERPSSPEVSCSSTVHPHVCAHGQHRFGVRRLTFEGADGTMAR